jgi:hypothetical protein
MPLAHGKIYHGLGEISFATQTVERLQWADFSMKFCCCMAAFVIGVVVAAASLFG